MPFWGINAELVAPISKRHRARFGGPFGVMPQLKSLARCKFSEKSARVVEESAFAAYCLCVT
jgi:hypothetical protein